MKIAICDDDALLRGALKRYIENWAEKRQITISIHEYASAEIFLFHWSPEENFDILFLDIQMPNMSGVELAEIIRRVDKDLIIAFVTGSMDYVLEGYKVKASNYLVKPVREEDCAKYLDEVYEELSNADGKHLLINAPGKVRKINYQDIYYFESFAHDVVVHINEHGRREELQFKKNIGELEAELANTQFIRTHRSFIVNMNHVSSVEKTCLILDDKTSIQISRANWKLVYDTFIRRFV